MAVPEEKISLKEAMRQEVQSFREKKPRREVDLGELRKTLEESLSSTGKRNKLEENKPIEKGGEKNEIR